MLDLAVALGPGGDCLAYIAALRAEPGVFGRVASDPTVSRTIDALAPDAPAALRAIRARAAAKRRAWGLAGEHAPDAGITAASPLVGGSTLPPATTDDLASVQVIVRLGRVLTIRRHRRW